LAPAPERGQRDEGGAVVTLNTPEAALRGLGAGAHAGAAGVQLEALRALVGTNS
jgi:hypothetical protein